MTDASAPPEPAAAPRPRKRYKIVGPQAWVEMKALYLVGVPASELAVRFDVTEHALRKRMTKEGWTRRAHASAVLHLALPRVGGDRRPAEVVAAMAQAAAAHAQGDAPKDGEEERAEAGPRDGDGEADPLEAARTLLLRAAASAVAGRLAGAAAGVKLAEALARAAAALGLGGDDDEADAAPEWGLSPAEAARRQEQANAAAMSELERADLDAGVARLARNLTDPSDPLHPELRERARAAERRLAALRAAALAYAAGDRSALPGE